MQATGKKKEQKRMKREERAVIEREEKGAATGRKEKEGERGSDC